MPSLNSTSSAALGAVAATIALVLHVFVLLASAPWLQGFFSTLSLVTIFDSSPQGALQTDTATLGIWGFCAFSSGRLLLCNGVDPSGIFHLSFSLPDGVAVVDTMKTLGLDEILKSASVPSPLLFLLLIITAGLLLLAVIVVLGGIVSISLWICGSTLGSLFGFLTFGTSLSSLIIIILSYRTIANSLSGSLPGVSWRFGTAFYLMIVASFFGLITAVLLIRAHRIKHIIKDQDRYGNRYP
ncbi:uncharacterized protein BJ171DRAFT_507465 [Polychytrium aggregatum]|uniref:uncharacterized protein n=1 Tax=Polychytrium aggregatum TaxID=110093 RepID=UPI0022FDF664|nr:uncharacterized protein BJ171DRAFT_507465 [Polychytrium aggregatum]KAI9204041.1 hypothetical protein BJ171DRAFT_507465 [Polychytrium aggregatum]